jgi:hypothetical protein
MKLLLLITIVIVGVALASPAHAKAARCVVTVEKRTIIDGPCSFQAEDGDGSFSLAAVNPQAWLTSEVGSLALWVKKPGFGEVFVVGERASRWGTARRSKTDKACWIGSAGNFKICAY